MDDPVQSTGPPRAPRWVKVSGIGALILIALVAIVVATGGPGQHGPGRHSGGGDDRPATTAPEGHAPPQNLPEGHEPPPGRAPPE